MHVFNKRKLFFDFIDQLDQLLILYVFADRYSDKTNYHIRQKNGADNDRSFYTLAFFVFYYRNDRANHNDDDRQKYRQTGSYINNSFVNAKR